MRLTCTDEGFGKRSAFDPPEIAPDVTEHWLHLATAGSAPRPFRADR